MKNKIVATELVEERERCDFDQNELFSIYFPPSGAMNVYAKTRQELLDDPVMAKHQSYYEMPPGEAQLSMIKKMNYMWHNKDRKFFWGPDSDDPMYVWGWS